MVWTQVYYPSESVLLSTLLAALPIALLLGVLATGKVSAPLAAILGLLAAFLVGLLFYVPIMPDQPEYWQRVAAWLPTLTAAAAQGAAFGLFPIGWIVFAAIFLYSLTVETGQFEIVKHSVARLSEDRRIQALLIAFCFGAFVEGAAGFGTPVAISAALMVGAGFRPLHAAGLALLANTSPVAFGALGTPILTLADVTGEDALRLSAMAGRQLPLFSLIVPVWLIWTMSGWRGVAGVWPALLVVGGCFAAVQFAVANFHGPWLVDVAGGLISLVCLALLLKVWQPRHVWQFAEEGTSATGTTVAAGATVPVATSSSAHSPELPTRWQVAYAWVPWGLLTLLVFLWGIPQVKTALGAPSKATRKAFIASPDSVDLKGTRIMIKVPALHQKIARDRPVVAEREAPEPAIFDLSWLSATGTGIFLAAILSAVWLRVGPRHFMAVLGRTAWRMRWPLFTITCMLAIAFVTRTSGMDATLGLAFTRTGWVYPVFAALLGWLGVALTGSDTSSNALFGMLQKITAQGLVLEGTLPLSEHQAVVLLTSANSTGGVMGKMIDAQSIVVAAAATQQYGQEGAILRFVFWHSLILAILMGLLVLAQAHLWSWMIPA